MGIFDGLEKFGLGSIDKKHLFDDGKKVEKKQVETQTVKLEDLKEEDYLLDKQMRCPVCDNNFKTKAMKTSKARRIGADKDLRPRFQGIDSIKYDVASCPKCGYTAMMRFFPHLSMVQIKLLKEKVWDNFKPSDEELPETYSYEYALEKYKLALFCTLVKMGKVSERAYACLKMSWLCRGQLEAWKAQGVADDDEKVVKRRREEREYYEQAYEGLTKAVASEPFPICGMDQHTVDLLLAEMAFILGKYENASKLVSRLLTSQTVKNSVKDKAHDLKEEIVEVLKNKQ